MNISPSILIAGIGNIFLGDDAFGSEVAQRLLRMQQPPGVQVIDFGIRGLDLMYALGNGCELAVLIDAVPRGELPGTLFLLEPQIDAESVDGLSPMIDAHTMDPVKVLRAARAMGPLPAHLFIVGCEPTPLPIGEDDDVQMEMSAPVRAAVDGAVALVGEVVNRFIRERSDRSCAAGTPVGGAQQAARERTFTERAVQTKELSC